MSEPSYGILENYSELGVGIIEFALDDYVSTVKSLRHFYKKLDNSLNENLGRPRKYHERCGDVCRDIYKRIQNLNEIEKFLTGDYAKKLTTLDVDRLFQETRNKLITKGYRVNLMGMIVRTDEKGAMVFAREIKHDNGNTYTMYSVGVSSKNQQGGWVNGYLPCRFKKGVTVANKTKIKINSAFFTASKSGDKVYTSLMITDFDVLEQGENPADDFIKIPEGIDNEVPFL